MIQSKAESQKTIIYGKQLLLIVFYFHIHRRFLYNGFISVPTDIRIVLIFANTVADDYGQDSSKRYSVGRTLPIYISGGTPQLNIPNDFPSAVR